MNSGSARDTARYSRLVGLLFQEPLPRPLNVPVRQIVQQLPRFRTARSASH